MHLRLLLPLSLSLLLGCPTNGSGDDDDDSASADSGLVVFETTLGSFSVEVYEAESPVTAANFVQYVDDGFYDGRDGEGETLFHRVVPDFVIQGGGVLASGALKETRDPIVNEAAASGLSNAAGTLSMARLNAPDTATSQFFVNTVDNPDLDPGGFTPDGYAVFGAVVDGFDTVLAIEAVQRDGNDQPLIDVVIESAARVP